MKNMREYGVVLAMLLCSMALTESHLSAAEAPAAEVSAAAAAAPAKPRRDILAESFREDYAPGAHGAAPAVSSSSAPSSAAASSSSSAAAPAAAEKPVSTGWFGGLWGGRGKPAVPSIPAKAVTPGPKPGTPPLSAPEVAAAEVPAEAAPAEAAAAEAAAAEAAAAEGEEGREKTPTEAQEVSQETVMQKIGKGTWDALGATGRAGLMGLLATGSGLAYAGKGALQLGGKAVQLTPDAVRALAGLLRSKGHERAFRELTSDIARGAEKIRAIPVYNLAEKMQYKFYGELVHADGTVEQAFRDLAPFDMTTIIVRNPETTTVRTIRIVPADPSATFNPFGQGRSATIDFVNVKDKDTGIVIQDVAGYLAKGWEAVTYGPQRAVHRLVSAPDFNALGVGRAIALGASNEAVRALFPLAERASKRGKILPHHILGNAYYLKTDRGLNKQIEFDFEKQRGVINSFEVQGGSRQVAEAARAILNKAKENIIKELLGQTEQVAFKDIDFAVGGSQGAVPPDVQGFFQAVERQEYAKVRAWLEALGRSKEVAAGRQLASYKAARPGDSDGNFALHIAALRNDPLMAQVLINNGFDTQKTQQNGKGERPIDLALKLYPENGSLINALLP